MPKNPKRKIMRALKLDEISAVDTPAQEGAVMVLMKRHDESTEKNMGLSDVFTTSDDGHQHGITIETHDGQAWISVSHASGPEGDMHSHQVMRGENGEMILSENEGHTHDVDANMLQTAVMNTMLTVGKEKDDPNYRSSKSAEDVGKTQPIKDDDMADKDAGNTAELQKKDDTIARLQAVLDLSPEHRAHYDGLSVSKQDDFLTLPDADKDTAIEKAASANPVIFTAEDGTEYRKSDDPRLVKMAQERDADREAMNKFRVEAEHEAFTKQADDLLGLVPGEKVEKVALVKAVATIEDDEVKKAALTILENANKIYKSAMSTLGSTEPTSTVDAPNSAAELLKSAVAACAKEEGIAKHEAQDKILKTKAGMELYERARQERIMNGRRN